MRLDADYDENVYGGDCWPLQDPHLEIRVEDYWLTTSSASATVDPGTGHLLAYPYAIPRDGNGDVTVTRADDTPCCSLGTDADGVGWGWCTGGFSHWYSLGVPDDATSVAFTLEFWQDTTRFGLQNDVAASIASSGANVVTDTWTINEDLSVSSGLRTYVSGTIATVDGKDLKNSLSVLVEAHGGSRSDVYLVLPDDYSGIYNVTDAAGATIARRYVGENRFVSVLVEGVNPDPNTKVRATATTYLVPRSVFFDTALYRDLQDASKLALPPYTAMKGYQNATGSANSDDLQMTFAFDGLDAAGKDAVWNALQRNATSVESHVLLLWTGPDWSDINSPYFVGLPADVVRSVPLVAWYSTPSHPENLAAPPPLPFWVRLFTGDPTALAEVLNWVHSALVTVANFFVDLGQALVNFGSWLGDLTSGDPARVQRAVKAAQKALDGFKDWIVNGATALLRSLMPALDGQAVAAALGLPAIPNNGMNLSPEIISGFVNAVLSGWFFTVLIAIGLAVEAVATWLSLQSFGAAMVVKGILGPKIVEVIIQGLLKSMVKSLAVNLAEIVAIEGILYLVRPEADPFWREGVGLSLFGFALAAYKLVVDRGLFRQDPTKVGLELAGFAVSVIGLIVAFVSAGVIGAWIGLLLAGIGFLIAWKNNDLFDLSPVSPLNAVEEITGIVAVGYAVANVAEEYA